MYRIIIIVLRKKYSIQVGKFKLYLCYFLKILHIILNRVVFKTSTLENILEDIKFLSDLISMAVFDPIFLEL